MKRSLIISGDIDTAAEPTRKRTYAADVYVKKIAIKAGGC
jgi:hypothetical protein